MQDRWILPVACRLEDLPLSGEAVSALIESLVGRRPDALHTAAERDPLLAARLLLWDWGRRDAQAPCDLAHVLDRFNAACTVAFASSTLLSLLDPPQTSVPETFCGKQGDRLFGALRTYAYRVAKEASEHAESQGQENPGATFLVALLGSLGPFVLAYCFPADYVAMLRASTSPADLRSREIARFGADSHAIGRRLARSWGLPRWIAASEAPGAGGPAADAAPWRALRAALEVGDTDGDLDDSTCAASSYPVTREALAELVRLATGHDLLLAERREFLEQEKLEALAEFAAGAGHEINNPLAVIYGRAQLLLADETDPERRRALLTMGAQAMRVHEMIADLMLFARPPLPQRERLDLSPLVSETFASLAAKADERGVTLRFAPPAFPVEAWGDPVQVRVVLGNLITNSLESLEQGGSVEVTLRQKKAAPGLPPRLRGSGGQGRATSAESLPSTTSAVLRVRDDGPGLTDDIRRHLFDPFFSGRQAGRGLGLGLGKCWRIIDAHGGKIRVKSRPGEGTTFSVWLPGCPVHVVDEPPGNGRSR